MLDVMEMILIMPDFIIAFLIVASVGGLGLLLIMFSISEWIYYAKIPKCIEITEGKIIKHRCLGEGEIRPIIEYTVNGEVYRTTKRYAGLNEIRRPGITESKIWEDERGYLCIRGGLIVNVRKLMNEMWPIGDTVKVFYSPDNPKINYVDRPVYNRFMVTIFIVIGIFLICLCCIMLFMVNNLV